MPPRFTVTAEDRTCFRCGARFPVHGSGRSKPRVCINCKAPPKARGDGSKELTPREIQIVGLVSEGKANKEIAGTLHLAEGSIKEYVNRIFRKVSVSNRTELALWCLAQRAEASDIEIEEQTLP